MKRQVIFALAVLLAVATGAEGQVSLTVTSISPSSVFAGSSGFTLFVNGTGFGRVVLSTGVVQSEVRWNGVVIPTNFISSTQLQATVDAPRVASPGTASVDVLNPGADSNDVTFTIIPPLVITTTALAAGTVGGNYSQQLTGVGGTPPYFWGWSPGTGSLPPGLSLNTDSGIISGIPSATGTYSILVGLWDTYENYVSKTFPLIINPRPSVSTTSLPNGQVSVAYLQTLTVSGGTGPYTWSLATGQLPQGLSLSSANGQISGVPTTVGTASFTVRVTDRYSVSATSGPLGITIIPAPLSVTTASPLPAGTVGVDYLRTFDAAGGYPPYTWSVTSDALPPGLAFTSTSVLGGTPTQTGTWAFTVTVTDAARVTASKQFTLTVNPATLTITTASSLPGALVDSAYSQPLVATGGISPYSWSVAPAALPPGLALTYEGVLNGTPTQRGTFPFTVTVTDSARVTASKQFTLTVNAAALTITTASPLPGASVDSAYSQPLVATGGISPYTWSFASGALPAGLVFDSAGVLRGKPTQSGTFTFTMTVTDSAKSTASKQFVLTVIPAALAITTASPLPTGTAGVLYSQTFAATGGTTYTWSFTGSLPPGLGLTNGGLLSGTPEAAGTYNFTVTVNGSVSKQFVLTVNPATLTITTASPLPGASAGSAYAQTFAVTGGISPYAWSLTSGALPPGLTLTSGGALSGTPTQAGAYNFTVRVTDGSQASATKAFALTVSVPQAPIPSVTGLADTLSPAQQPSFDVQLGSGYPLAITGTIRLTFTPDAVAPADDPSIQFSSGGRTLSFTVPAGQMRAFPSSPPAIQTGTVAGRINLTLESLSAGGQDITPTPAQVRSVQIPRSAPSINSVRVVRTSGGFNVLVTGYSTPRQVTQAVFTFTPSSGSNLGTTQLTVPVDAAFTTWFTGTASGQFGSTFLYTQPFQVQGDAAAIASVSVTLSSSAGNSQSASASF